MNALDEIGRAQLVEEIRRAVHCELAAMTAVSRWVPTKEYCKYYGISPRTLNRKYPQLQWNKAMIGAGKSVRFDKFFNPITLRREGGRGI